MHQALSEHFATRFVGPISPASDYSAKLISKIRRINGQAGAFHFFSERRLKRIAKLVAHEIDETADCDFFHGSTPWVLYHSLRPYFLYVDTCFSTYIDVYHEREKFTPNDLKRISDLEADWLSKAERVFFGTRWALERAVADYHLARSNLSPVGAGGSMNPPEQDRYEGGMNFLFVALDFERKGGRICVEALGKVRARFAEASLTIIGERPPDDVLALPGICYEGLLRKSIPADLDKLEAAFTRAFALIHPTTSDIQPLVISEAGYFGCPSIAAKSFAIPELVEDGVTGFLIDTPLTTEAFAAGMIELGSNKDHYLSMRNAVRAHAITNLTWSGVGGRIVDEMKAALGRC
jgi:glycosyltransferase involved in cell wall biosynthesis